MSIVKPTIRFDKKNLNNECQIAFVYSKGKRNNYISTNMFIPISMWDFSKNRIKLSYPRSRQINSALKIKANKLSDNLINIKTKHTKANRLETYNRLVFVDVKLIDFMSDVMKEYISEKNTVIKQKSIFNKFKNFLISINKIDLKINELSYNHIIDYENYMRSVLNNKENTIATNLNFIKIVIKKAISEKLLAYEENPFNKIKIKTERTNKSYFSEQEIIEFENYKTDDVRIRISIDIFLVGCECGGIRISDLLKMKIGDYDGIHLNFIITKTNEQLRIKVPNKSKKIIENYINGRNDANKFIFPFLKDDIDLNNNYIIKRAIKSKTEYINRRLKKVAKHLNILKPISMNTSRHTFATRALSKGSPIHIVQKILGHKEIKNTMIYAKIINTELDKAMDLF